MSQTVSIRDVEIRSWPELTDLVVIDLQQMSTLAFYDLEDPRPYLPWDLRADYQARCDQAIEFLEDAQEDLREWFSFGDDHLVKLQPSDVMRKRLDDLLREYDLSLDDVSFANLSTAIATMRAMPVDRLFALLCDWFDVVERHYPAGAAMQDPKLWIHRAAPDRACQHAFLVSGKTDVASLTPEQREESFELFRELIDVKTKDFSLGQVIRYVYYMQTEFADREPFVLQAMRA